MKQESDKIPSSKFEIENIEDNRCEVVFFDTQNLQEEVKVDENGVETKSYTYYSYRTSMPYHDNLETYLNDNYETLFESVKEMDRKQKEAEIRAKRDALLVESDKEMVFDRLGFETPDNINASNMLSTMITFFGKLKSIFSNDWAIYRQNLRDITKQEGFPYDVIFPEKPKDK